MEIQLSDSEKLSLLGEDVKKDDILFAIRREDIQAEAISKMGRLLKDDEVEEVTERLENCLGENMALIYNVVLQ